MEHTVSNYIDTMATRSLFRSLLLKANRTIQASRVSIRGIQSVCLLKKYGTLFTVGISGAAAARSLMNEVEAQPETRKGLFPEIEPYNTGFLQVSETHRIYFEESGNPQGKPVVFVHGGPGGGTTAKCRQFFDPNYYRIILFDQRGCGKSTPHACLEENTTWHLVADIEKLRAHLGIEKWQVFGGSWGSTLSLTYAETHPERVSELILRGIFMIRKKELDFFYQKGANFIFPDAWESYRDAIPVPEQGDFVTAYNKRLTSDDPEEQLKAAKAWTTWEMRTSNLIQKPEGIARGEDEKFALAFARIENHYFVNRAWLPTENYLLENVWRIRHIPTVIVQGRYDVVCPMESAWELHRNFPEADFHVIPDAGHSMWEEGILSKLVEATEKFKERK